MFDKFRLSAKQVFIYSLGNIFSKLVGFILLPLYSQHISISDYSSLILIEPIWQLLSAVLSFSLPTALLRWLAPEKDFKRQGSMVFTTLMALVFILLAFNLLAFPFNAWVNHQGVYDDPKFKLYLDISFLLVTFDVLNLLVLSLLRFHEKPWQYIILNTLKLSVNLGLNIYFIVRLKMGVEAILLSQLIASVLLNVFSSPFLIKHLVPKFEVGPLKEMLKYGFPLIFTSISAIILSLGDRYVVQHFLTRSDTGVYGIGYKFGGIINMFIIQSFQLGFLPIAYKMLEDAGAKRFFSRIFTYYFGILMLSAFALSVFSHEIVAIFTLGNPDYMRAYVVIPLISFGFVLKGTQTYFSLGLHYVKKTKYNAWIVMLCAVFSIGMNILLVPKMGIYGAALMMLVSNGLLALFFYLFSQKFYYIRFEGIRLLKLLFTGLALFFIGYFIPVRSLLISILLKLILLMAFPLILYLLRFFDKDEVNRLLQMVHALHLKKPIKK